MSAIYGAINLKKKEMSPELLQTWKNTYSTYAIDRQETILADYAFMGCALQYFHEEAKREILPIWDTEKNIFFTADCVLDNREELIQSLRLNQDTPDGEIIYRAYLSWGKECAIHLRGTFSFVVCDMKSMEVTLCVDQFAQRCLFYHVRDDILYFSTLLKPLLKDTGLNFEKNERWLVDTLSIRGPMIVTEPRETALTDVFKVVSGTYVLVNQSGEVSQQRYFDPARQFKTDKSITLKQSEEMVRQCMTEVVGKILRSGDHIGAQLSCGLDSSTVACIAAGIMAPLGKEINSYTSVPDPEAGLVNKGYLIYDESEGVKTICRAYPNIHPHFVDTAHRNYLKEAEHIVELWELPCKSQQNAIWVEEILLKAREDGCKILLAGSTGNCTISAGSFDDILWQEFTHGHWGKVYHILDALKDLGASRKRYLKSLLKKIKKYYGWYFDASQRDCYADISTRKELGEKHAMTERFHKNLYHYRPFLSLKGMQKAMYMVNANAQIGEIDTKLSLASGILTRDPMRTVELVKLCFTLPMECFASADFDRRLVRVGMEGIVPGQIREDVAHRGRQSGDNTYRIRKVWEELQPTIREQLYGENMLYYLDKEKLDRLWESVCTEGSREEEADYQQIVDLYSFAKYLEYLAKF